MRMTAASHTDTGSGTIEREMELALHGDRRAALKFYQYFLAGPLFVPQRQQDMPLSDAPSYPDPFLNVLGLKGSEHVTVPVFSRPELIREWCGNSLKFRILSGRELTGLLPKEWWICVNPGLEIEKELSSWELDCLRAGDAGISAVIDELFDGEQGAPMEVMPVLPEEYQRLRETLIRISQQFKEVSRIFLLKEEGRDLDGEPLRHVLVGVEHPKLPLPRALEIRAYFKAASEEALIGSDSVRLFCGSREDNPIFGIFAGFEPLNPGNSQTATSRPFLARLRKLAAKTFR